MSIEDLPDGFTVPTRSEIRDKFQRDFVLRQPGAPTGPGSQAFIDGSVIADTLAPVYADAVSIARGANLDDMTREQLKDEASALGIPEELPASAGSGFVVITASSGGVFIDSARELKDDSRKLRFRCASSATYFDAQPVPIIGIDVGPATNIPAGTTLKWTNPPAGLGATATVQADADGRGLTGGRNAETDDDIRNRIRAEESDKAAAGNVAEIRLRVKEAARVLGIAIREVFVYPAVVGAGHYSYVFTLRPGSPGDSRVPDSVQIAAVRAYIHGVLPEDDGILAAELIDEDVDLRLGIEWAKGAEGWLDAQPWPLYSDGFKVSTVTSATVFRVVGTTAVQPPAAGKTFAFYDASEGTFVRKKILTATFVSGTSYDIVVDATNNVSDVNYVPAVNEEMCPWSASLDLIVAPLVAEFDALGPGQQVEEPFDEGYRQKRMPEDPYEWPSALRHNALDGVDDLSQVLDVEWLEPDMPHAPAVGVAGVSANLLFPASILAFPI